MGLLSGQSFGLKALVFRFFSGRFFIGETLRLFSFNPRFFTGTGFGFRLLLGF